MDQALWWWLILSLPISIVLGSLLARNDAAEH
jgi:hypothetical protein